jgi:aryl-alcohol dehydrogenase-like predicted oxidoreductase
MGGFEALRNNMDLILGTALWGWTIPENTCFEILDEFYKNGFRGIDTATNYPINKDPKFFRFAEAVIMKWIEANGINDLKITIKAGSIDNSGLPENNLTYSFLIMSHEYYREKFEDNLDTFMVHWDNRDDEESILKTIDSLKIIRKKCKVGLSGMIGFVSL